MKITNTKVIEDLLSSGIQVNSLVDKLFIISKLVKKHGRLLHTKDYVNEISNIDKDVAVLISILHKVKKLTHVDTKNLIQTIKMTQGGYKPEFIINSLVDHQEIDTYLHDKFKNSQIQTENKDTIGINIHGEGRYYKRSLDSDVKKILGL